MGQVNKEDGQGWSKFYFCSKHVVDGTNSYDGKFEDEEASM